MSMSHTHLLVPAAGALLVAACAAAGAAFAGAAPYPLADAVESRPRGGLPNVFAKLEAGREVRIAYLGGSITAQDGWRVKTLKWFQEQFPKAKVSEINAAIGGTGSDLGVYRLAHDVLRHKPDLLFVEFAVNDGDAAPEAIWRSMEGIVRQTWRADPTTDICYVYTITASLAEALDRGKFPRAAGAMERIADHYAIPSIHMALEAARLAREGRLVWAGKQPKTDAEREALGGKIVFAEDGVHPFPETGHQLYLEAILRAMPAIRAAGKPGPHPLPDPFVKDNGENAKLLPLDRAALAGGWAKLDPAKDGLAKAYAGRMGDLWRTDTPGASVAFRFKGTAAAVYDLLGPDCGQVIVTLDGGPPQVRPRFDRYSTYHRLATLSIGAGLPDAVHTVRLELHPDPPDKAAIFRKGDQHEEDPAGNPKYAGRAWYAGGILLVGDLVDAPKEP